MSYTEKPVVSKPYPEEVKTSSMELLESTINMYRKAPQAKGLAVLVASQYPNHHKQVIDEAEAIGVDSIDVMLGNLSYDLLMATLGCTTIVIPTENGPVAARNMDWFPPGKIAKASCLVPTENGLSAGFAGSVGVVTGLSKNGFALILNAAMCGDTRIGAYPMLLFLRHVLDTAKDYDDAVRIVTYTPLMSSGLITIVGKENHQRVCIERKPMSAAIRKPEDGKPLIVTNHFRLLSKPDGTCERYNFLEKKNIRESDLMDLLTCDCVLASITSQHIVIKPASNEMKLYVPDHCLEEDYDTARTTMMLSELGLN